MRDWFILVLYTIWYVISFGCFRRNVIEPTDFLNRKEISNREAENSLHDFYREKSLARKRLIVTWDEEYIREATGNTIQGVIDYVLSGETIGLDDLESFLGMYSELETFRKIGQVHLFHPCGTSFYVSSPDEIIDNYITVHGTSELGPYLFRNTTKVSFSAGVLTADKITTSRPLYSHSDL